MRSSGGCVSLAYVKPNFLTNVQIRACKMLHKDIGRTLQDSIIFSTSYDRGVCPLKFFVIILFEKIRRDVWELRSHQQNYPMSKVVLSSNEVVIIKCH